MVLKNDQNVRVLVVDDDQQLADMLVEFLVKLGYQASVAHGGREGLVQFEQGDFQLVILDLKLPDMDGLEVLEAIKAVDSRAVVLIITGYGTIESSVTAIKKGAYDFIPKPINLEFLELTINRALEKHTLFKQLGIFRGLALALIISVPVWLILGIILARILLK
jgi:DNA-binding NtrC family response regulator